MKHGGEILAISVVSSRFRFLDIYGLGRKCDEY
jgi:hypothetical protein